MPKLREREAEKRLKEFKSVLRKNMELAGIDNFRELGKRIGMSETTIYVKIKDPERFTLGELRKIFGVLKFSDEDKRTIF